MIGENESGRAPVSISFRAHFHLYAAAKTIVVFEVGGVTQRTVQWQWGGKMAKRCSNEYVE